MAARTIDTCSGEPKKFSSSFVPFGYCASLAFSDARSVAVYWFMLAVILTDDEVTDLENGNTLGRLYRERDDECQRAPFGCERHVQSQSHHRRLGVKHHERVDQ